MNLEDFITSKLKETEFYNKNEDMFCQYIPNMEIEDSITAFVEQYASQRKTQNDYKIFTEHVLDSPGLDIYITFVSYSEYYNKEIKIDSFIITSYCY